MLAPAAGSAIKGYLIANIDVRDAATFARYREQVAPLIARHGGRYLVRGGEISVLEGSPSLKRLVVIEFPSLEAARTFYDSEAYRSVLALRLASSSGDVALVAGWEPPA